MKKAVLAAMVLGLAATGAWASSDEAWDQFRAEVHDSCAALVDAPDEADVSIDVNPFGSESYGGAIVAVSDGDNATVRMLCIFDKHSRQAELTAPFEEDEATR